MLRQLSYLVISILLFSFTAIGVAADPDVKFESYNKNSFDQVFSRADRLGDTLEWQKAVESGKKALKAVWEADAIRKIEEALTKVDETQKIRVRTELNNKLAIAKAQWELAADAEIDQRKGIFLAKKSSLEANLNREAIIKALKEANSQYATNEFKTDLQNWDNKLNTLKDSLKKSSSDALDNKITTLASSSGLSGAALAKYLDQLQAKKKSVMLDWDLSADYLIVRDRNKFVAKRLYDRSSLKFQSDKESAEYIVKNVLDETDANARKAVRDALKKNGAQVGDTPTMINLNGLGADWQDKVQAALKQGLSLWDKASSDVLARFEKWKTTTKDAFDEANKRWETAYRTLKEARTKWESDIRAQINAGLDKWTDKENEMLKNRQEAEQRLDQYLAQQNQEWQDYSTQLQTLYTRGSDAIGSAIENIKWIENKISYNSNVMLNYANSVGQEVIWDRVKDWYKGFSATNNQWNYENDYLKFYNMGPELRSHWSMQNFRKSEFNSSFFENGSFNVYADHIYSHLVFLTHAIADKYRRPSKQLMYHVHKVVEVNGVPTSSARLYFNNLSTTINLTNFDCYKNFHFYKKELVRWQRILDDFVKLNSQAVTRFHNGDMWQGDDGISMLANPNDAYLYTDSEFALEKNKRELAYWEKQLNIARAVYTYATNTSSGRESAEQTKQLMQSAETTMNVAHAAYSNALFNLNTTAISNVSYHRDNLTTYSQSLEESRSNFQKAKTTYEQQLATVRALQNKVDATEQKRDLSDTFRQWERQRKNLVEIQSNYSRTYADLRKNEIMYGYASQLVYIASNADVTTKSWNLYEDLTASLTNTDQANLIDTGNALLGKFDELLPGGALTLKSALETAISNLGSGTLVTEVDALQAKGVLLSTIRRIERAVYVEHCTMASNFQLALSPSTFDMGLITTNLMKSQYSGMQIHASNALAAADYLCNAVEKFLTNDMSWTSSDGDLIDNNLILSNAVAQQYYYDSSIDNFSDGDGFNLLITWYTTNVQNLLDAGSETFTQGTTRWSMMSNLYVTRDSVQEIATFLSTNTLTGDERLQAAQSMMEYLPGFSYETAGFKGISMVESGIQAGLYDFASYARLSLMEGAGNEATKLYLKLNDMLEGRSFYGESSSELLRTAEAFIKTVNESQVQPPDFVIDSINEINNLVVTLKQQKQYLEYKSMSKTETDLTNEIATLRASGELDSMKMKIAMSVLDILQNGSTNTVTLLNSLLTNSYTASILQTNPEGLSNLIASATISNLDPIGDAATKIYLVSSSNGNVYDKRIAELNGILYYYQNGSTLTSARDYLKGLLLYAGSNSVPISVQEYTALDLINAQYDNWTADIITFNTEPLKSQYSYAVFSDNGSPVASVANAYLDTINNLADRLYAFKNGSLSALNHLNTITSNSVASFQDLMRGSYDVALGYTNASMVSNINSSFSAMRTAYNNNNTKNNSGLSSDKASWTSGFTALASVNQTIYAKGKNIKFSDQTVEQYLASAQYTNAKAAFVNTTDALSNQQWVYAIAKSNYDAASSQYYVSMTNTANLEKIYLGFKEAYDLRAAIYSYASTPYTKQNYDPATQSGINSSTNSVADARVRYERMLNNYTNAKAAYDVALAAYNDAPKLNDLTSSPQFSDYATARTTYQNDSQSMIRYEKAYADIQRESRLLKDKIAEAKTAVANAEAALFYKDFEQYNVNGKTGQQLREQILQGILKGEITLADFQDWMFKDRMRLSYVPNKIKCWAGTIELDIRPRIARRPHLIALQWNDNVNQYGNPVNQALYNLMGETNNGVVNDSVFADLINPYLTMVGWEAGYQIASWERSDCGIFSFFRKSKWNSAKSYLLNGGFGQKGFYAARNEYNAKTPQLTGVLSAITTSYAKLKNLEAEMVKLDTMTLDNNSVSKGYNLSDNATRQNLTQIRADLFNKLRHMGLQDSDFSSLHGEAGLQQLSTWLGNSSLGLVAASDRKNEFGNLVVDGNGQPVQNYTISAERIIEVLKNQQQKNTQDSLNAFTQKATDKSVDPMLFLKDREMLYYGLTKYAQSLKDGSSYKGFVDMANALTAVGTEAWTNLKSQEKILQLQKWDFKQNNFNEEKQRWEDTARDIYGRGNQQWDMMMNRFRSAWDSWYKESKDKIEKAEKKWKTLLDSLSQQKKQWVDNVQKAAAKSGAEALKVAMESTIKDTINSLMSSMPGNIDFGHGLNPDKLVADMLRQNRVSMLSPEFMKIIDSADTTFTMSEVSAFSSSSALNGMQQKMDEFDKASKVMQHMRAFDTLDQMMQNYDKMIKGADDGTRKNITSSMVANGFKKNGNNWTRRVIKDASLVSTEYTTQYIQDYASYKYAPFSYDLKVDNDRPFEASMFKTLSTAEVESLVTASKIKLKTKFDYLMNDDPNNPANKGSFAEHIGFAPFDVDAAAKQDKKIKPEDYTEKEKTSLKKGAGQYGIIFSALQAANIQKAEGEAKAQGGFWEMDIIPGAPSLMSVAKIGLSIAGGPWASFALDTFVTGAMVACGKMSLSDGFMSTMKGVAGNIAGSLAGSLGGELGDIVKDLGLGDVTASVTSSLASTAMNHYANAVIQAVEIGPGGLTINKDKFKKGASGIGGSLLKAGVTSLVSSSIMAAKGAKWKNGKMGFHNKIGKTSQIAKNLQQNAVTLSSRVAGLVGEGISLAQGDGFSLNVLNSADIFGSGGGLNHQGLLSFTIGGKNSGFSFGSKGLDVSASGINSFMNSLDYFDEGIKKDLGAQYYMKNKDTDAGMAKISLLDIGLMSKNKAGLSMVQSVLSGHKSIAFSLDQELSGHAGVETSDNIIHLSKDAINISEDSLDKAGSYASIAARESFLIDANRDLMAKGLANKDGIFSAKDRHSLTWAATKLQAGMMQDLTEHAGIQFTGKYGKLKSTVEYLAKTGDFTGWAVTGRDFLRGTMIADPDGRRAQSASPSYWQQRKNVRDADRSRLTTELEKTLKQMKAFKDKIKGKDSRTKSEILTELKLESIIAKCKVDMNGLNISQLKDILTRIDAHKGNLKKLRDKENYHYSQIAQPKLKDMPGLLYKDFMEGLPSAFVNKIGNIQNVMKAFASIYLAAKHGTAARIYGKRADGLEKAINEARAVTNDELSIYNKKGQELSGWLQKLNLVQKKWLELANAYHNDVRNLPDNFVVQSKLESRMYPGIGTCLYPIQMSRLKSMDKKDIERYYQGRLNMLPQLKKESTINKQNIRRYY